MGVNGAKLRTGRDAAWFARLSSTGQRIRDAGLAADVADATRLTPPNSI